MCSAPTPRPWALSTPVAALLIAVALDAAAGDGQPRSASGAEVHARGLVAADGNITERAAATNGLSYAEVSSHGFVAATRTAVMRRAMEVREGQNGFSKRASAEQAAEAEEVEAVIATDKFADSTVAIEAAAAAEAQEEDAAVKAAAEQAADATAADAASTAKDLEEAAAANAHAYVGEEHKSSSSEDVATDASWYGKTTATTTGGLLVSIGDPPRNPLLACQGDCDSDDDCMGGLICFQRVGTENVPRCGGSGDKGWDYCQPAVPKLSFSNGKTTAPAPAPNHGGNVQAKNPYDNVGDNVGHADSMREEASTAAQTRADAPAASTSGAR